MDLQLRYHLAVVMTLALACSDPVSPPMSAVGCYEIRMSPTPEHPNEVGAWDFRPGGFHLPERIELLVNATLLTPGGAVRPLPRGSTMFWQATWQRSADDIRLEIWFGAEEQAVELDLTWSGRSWMGTASDWSDVGSVPRRTAPAELRSVSCS